MTLAKKQSPQESSRVSLKIETLETREAPGRFGGWDWAPARSWFSSWRDSWRTNSYSHFQRSDSSTRSCEKPSPPSCSKAWEPRTYKTCKPTPPPCPPPATETSQIGGIAYVDIDLDAMYNPGEPLLSNVAVTLTGTASNGTAVNLQTTTNAAGAYDFGSLAAGTYAISVVTPNDYVPGHSGIGDFGGVPGENVVTDLVVPVGQTSEGYDFGFEIPIPN